MPTIRRQQAGVRALTLTLLRGGMWRHPGLIAPTSGTVTIYGDSLEGGVSSIRKSLGLCPQYDILWPEITVREHLLMYAHFKGMRRDQNVAKEVRPKR